MKREAESALPPRFLARGERLTPGAVVRLNPDEARHARSRRMGDGDDVVLLDGQGRLAFGVLTGDGQSVLVDRLEQMVREPALAVTVLLWAAEPARIEWSLEKGTECGASRFILVAGERSQAAHAAALAARHARLERIVAEAVKQCGRSVVPAVVGPVSLAEALELSPGPLCAAEPGGPPMPAGDRSNPGAGVVTISIGPEGGFSPGEREALRQAGAVFGSLGPRILRLETAVVVALTRVLDGS